MSCVTVTATPAGQRSASNYLYNPATCKRGLHSLAETGYSHTENGVENLLRITCPVCLAQPHPDHTWRLRTTPPAPAAAELDDSAYGDVEPQFQAWQIPHPSSIHGRLAVPTDQPSSPSGSARQS